MELKTLAKAGYEAYGKTTDNKNYQGLPMPKFDELPKAIVNAWIAATKQICKIYEFDKTQQIIKSGYAGTLPNGNIVDRRTHPNAIPAQENSLLGIPKPVSVKEQD